MLWQGTNFSILLNAFMFSVHSNQVVEISLCEKENSYLDVSQQTCYIMQTVPEYGEGGAEWHSIVHFLLSFQGFLNCCALLRTYVS